MLTVKSKAPPESVDAFHFFLFHIFIWRKSHIPAPQPSGKAEVCKTFIPQFDSGWCLQNKKHFLRSAFCFGTMCSACAECDAYFVRDVSFGSDVRFAREDAEHITSLCTAGATHHYGEAMASLRRSRYITFYKRSKLCYNITESEVLLWQSQNYANYQWSFPLIS